MDAVRTYVGQGERKIIKEVVKGSVKTAQETLKEKPLEELAENIEDKIAKYREELRSKQEQEGDKIIQVM